MVGIHVFCDVFVFGTKNHEHISGTWTVASLVSSALQYKRYFCVVGLIANLSIKQYFWQKSKFGNSILKLSIFSECLPNITWCFWWKVQKWIYFCDRWMSVAAWDSSSLPKRGIMKAWIGRSGGRCQFLTSVLVMFCRMGHVLITLVWTWLWSHIFVEKVVKHVV